MAMEFAKTASAELAAADDSWLPPGTRSFFVSGAGAKPERPCAFY
jgi:hypothetical protein